MLSNRERQFLRGELNSKPKEYRANLRTNIKKKVVEFRKYEVSLIVGNMLLPEVARDVTPLKDG